MTVISIKSLIAVIGAVAFSIGIRFQERVLRVPEPTANQLLLVTFAACRLVPFVVIYLLMGIDPHSDVPLFYDAASHALRGGVVYRDFWSLYSLLFAYVTALPLLIWHGLKSIVLLMVIIQGTAWWMPRPVSVFLLLNVLVAMQPSLW